ncbi:nicotinamide riboside transporter PnuC [Azohydromonas caseinilytica]|uniref:Nicotinamide riboside transporter PnuC n=1 Tax=Azohydromonas caseinilytica TaxID=2728836 RepID=A0A848F9I2_9BURK|nr:nicotinamide riboside transporter PnuC [Azohydromonas caseinilytica]NML14671.1 nicotinamide mononucleotide transporter [Azohydromonas caseinilytica]
MDWLQAAAFTLWGVAVSRAEVLAFVLALWMVHCNLRVNPLAWPLAIASSALYALLFAGNRLYGEALLQFVFIAAAFWGWWQWLRGTQDDGRALQVRDLGRRGLLRLGAVTLAAWPLAGWLLHSVTDSDVPYADAFTTVASLAGQWLLGRKYVQNWPTWLVVNIASVALFAFKGLWLTVLLYGVFAVLSAVGWRRWARLARRPQGLEPASA